jgi:hypothetical protein
MRYKPLRTFAGTCDTSRVRITRVSTSATLALLGAGLGSALVSVLSPTFVTLTNMPSAR